MVELDAQPRKGRKRIQTFLFGELSSADQDE